jgi:hypothetical protein
MRSRLIALIALSAHFFLETTIGKLAHEKQTYRAYRAFRALFFRKLGDPPPQSGLGNVPVSVMVNRLRKKSVRGEYQRLKPG